MRRKVLYVFIILLSFFIILNIVLFIKNFKIEKEYINIDKITVGLNNPDEVEIEHIDDNKYYYSKPRCKGYIFFNIYYSLNYEVKFFNSKEVIDNIMYPGDWGQEYFIYNGEAIYCGLNHSYKKDKLDIDNSQLLKKASFSYSYKTDNEVLIDESNKVEFYVVVYFFVGNEIHMTTKKIEIYLNIDEK